MSTPVTSWDFIRDIHKRTDTIAVFAWLAKGKPAVAFDGVPRTSMQWIVTAQQASSPDFQRKLRAANVKGFNIAISMNPLKDNAQGRTLDDVKEVRHLYLDLDSKPGSTGKQKIDVILADQECPRPAYILQTSEHNYQAIWKVHGLDTYAAEDTLKRLAAQYGGDRAIGGDLARVLRIPGLHNKKYDTTFQIVGTKVSNTIHPPQAFAYLHDRPLPDLVRQSPADSPAAPSGAAAARTTTSRAGGDTADQSARDWGYCCSELGKALTRGSSRTELTGLFSQLHGELLARAEARQKHNPTYYADHTIARLRDYWDAQIAARALPDQVPQLPPPVSNTDLPAPGPSIEPPLPILTSGHDSTTAAVPAYDPPADVRRKDEHYVSEMLRSGQDPEAVVHNLAHWRHANVPGAHEYASALVRQLQGVMDAPLPSGAVPDHPHTRSSPDAPSQAAIASPQPQLRRHRWPPEGGHLLHSPCHPFWVKLL